MKILLSLLFSTVVSAGGHPNTAIRKIDIKAYIEMTEPYLKDCAGPSKPAVDIEFKKFVDVDNDGIEELIMVGKTCYSGTGGPDLQKVFKLVGKNQLKDISPKDSIQSFNGEPIFPKDGNWIVTLDFENGYLVRTHTDNRYNNGSIKLYFKWSGNDFKLIRVHKSPA